MYEPYKSSKTVTHEDFGGRIFATINTTTAVHAQKMKMFKVFSWAKNTARGVRFLLRFNMYLFLAQCEQVYLCLARALNNMSYVHVLRKIRTTDNPSSCLSSPNCAINI